MSAIPERKAGCDGVRFETYPMKLGLLQQLQKLGHDSTVYCTDAGSASDFMGKVLRAEQPEAASKLACKKMSA